MFARNAKSKLPLLFCPANRFFAQPRLYAKISYSGEIEAYFTPDDDCAEVIINEIEKAQSSVRIQAYFFTCKAIAKKLSEVNERGINVEVILDRNQKDYKYSCLGYLMKNDVNVWLDSNKGLAHSKVIIIDKEVVITGSFNLTRAAQARNTENLLILKDSEFANFYFENFEKRQSLAHRMT